MRIRSLGLMLPGLAVAGCSSGTEPSGAAYHLEALAPPPSQSLPGQKFAQVRVRAASAGGRTINGITVRFSGDGTIEPSEAVTDQDGIATVQWTLPRIPYDTEYNYMGGRPGEFQLTARYGDAEAEMRTSAHALTLDQVDATGIYACGSRLGRLFCWGYRIDWVAPVPEGWRPGDLVEYPAAGQVLELQAISDALCVLGASGVPLCTGFRNDRHWVSVTGAPPLTHLTGGGSTFCGRAADSTAWCWSDVFDPVFSATQVSSTLRFAHLEAGGGSLGASDNYACGLTEDGTAWCWSIVNRYGQLGNGSTDPSSTPVQVSGNHHFKQIELSMWAACGVEQDDSVWCWGERGVLPAESHVPERVTVPGVMGPILDLGWVHGYVRIGNKIHVWTDDRLIPYPQLDALGPAALSAEGDAVCILTESSEAFCSWTLVYGGEETSLFGMDVVPVPRPGAPLPPLEFSRAASSRRSAIAAPPTSFPGAHRPALH